MAAERKSREARRRGADIPWTETDLMARHEGEMVADEKMDDLLGALGRDILDEPVPERLLAILEPSDWDDR